ncbi:MAG: hypothetical protein FD120_2799 [Gammaproteobacteria bacterium]|nr:MAG: hypothetical protein FD120_2799 [Gammaproteobacteria bacterium]
MIVGRREETSQIRVLTSLRFNRLCSSDSGFPLGVLPLAANDAHLGRCRSHVSRRGLNFRRWLFRRPCSDRLSRPGRTG